MDTRTVTVKGMPLDVEFEYTEGVPGSFHTEPIAEEVEVCKVVYKGVEVSDLLDISFTLEIEKAILELLKGDELEELLYANKIVFWRG